MSVTPEPNEAAKRVFIAYRQLAEIVKHDMAPAAAAANLESYNRIVETLHQCLSIDPAYADAIQHIEPLSKLVDNLPYKMGSEGRVLLGTAHSFIEMYLPPEEKKKTIGFQ